MAAITKASVKAYFETGDKPTQAQFVDFIDSYQDFFEVLQAIGTAATGGKLGIVRIQTASAVTVQAIGAVGVQVIDASATTSLTNILGFGAVGLQLVGAVATASAQNALGTGAVGRQLIESTGTASAQRALAAGTVGIQLIEAVATASARLALGTGTGVALIATTTTAGAQNQLALGTADTVQLGMLGVGIVPANAAIKSAHATSAENMVWFQHTHATTPAGINVQFTASSPDNNTIYAFKFADSTQDRCIIYSDGDLQNADNSYGAISDERLKQDIAISGSQWDDIKALGALVKKYKNKTDVIAYGDNAKIHIGWIAQDVQKVSPGLVIEGPDGILGVQYSLAYMKGMKALAEALERIEVLEAKLGM